MTLVFSIADYDYMAEALVRAGGFERGDVARSNFPDGEHYLRVEANVIDKHVVAVAGRSPIRPRWSCTTSPAHSSRTARRR